MGNAMKWSSPGEKRKEGTALVELHIGHMRDAHDIIGIQPENFTPVVLVPDSAVSRICCCPLPMVSIPHGFNAVVTRWGADVPGSNEEPTWPSGFHMFCCWNRVSRLVSEQYMIFDTPVRECKTADNITVNVDVLIVFCINSPLTFVYGIGAEKLDDLLRASQEEVLRQMAGEIEVVDIYDLFGSEKTKPYVDKMNEQFAQHGVKILSFTVRDVRIPGKMAKDFEDKTLYESKTLEAQMKEQSDKLKMNNEEALAKLQEECDNARMAAEERALTQKAEITKEVKEVMAQTEKRLALAAAQREADVTDIDTTNALEVSKISAEQSLLQNQLHFQMQAETDKLEADVESYEKQKWAQGQLEAAEKIAEGKTAVALAEGSAASAFSLRRLQEQNMKKIDIMEKIAHNKKINVVTSLENNTGLAPNNSLVTQITQQGMEAVRMKLAEATSNSAGALGLGKAMAAGLVRPMPSKGPKQQTMSK